MMVPVLLGSFRRSALRTSTAGSILVSGFLFLQLSAFASCGIATGAGLRIGGHILVCTVGIFFPSKPCARVRKLCARRHGARNGTDTAAYARKHAAKLGLDARLPGGARQLWLGTLNGLRQG